MSAKIAVTPKVEAEIQLIKNRKSVTDAGPYKGQAKEPAEERHQRFVDNYIGILKEIYRDNPTLGEIEIKKFKDRQQNKPQPKQAPAVTPKVVKVAEPTVAPKIVEKSPQALASSPNTAKKEIDKPKKVQFDDGIGIGTLDDDNDDDDDLFGSPKSLTTASKARTVVEPTFTNTPNIPPAPPLPVDSANDRVECDQKEAVEKQQQIVAINNVGDKVKCIIALIVGVVAAVFGVISLPVNPVTSYKLFAVSALSLSLSFYYAHKLRH